MKMAIIQDNIVVNLNKKYFLLRILPYEKYVINDLSWNYNVLSGSEDVLIFKNAEVYYGEWVDANLILHETVDYDHLARELVKLLPSDFRYFYLITKSFVLTLPTHLLVKLPQMSDSLIQRYNRILN